MPWQCRGNNESKWYAEGGYEPIAEKLFGSRHVNRFLLEYDTPRAGTFEPLRFMPRDKMVVLGLVSSKQAPLEPMDDLRRRIDEASRYVPLENLALSPQRSFASTAAGNLLTEDEQWRKLELIVETTRQVSGGIIKVSCRVAGAGTEIELSQVRLVAQVARWASPRYHT